MHHHRILPHLPVRFSQCLSGVGETPSTTRLSTHTMTSGSHSYQTCRAYFEQQPTPSQHYAIDVSLRAGVRRTYEKAMPNSPDTQTNPTPPLFLVIEQTAAVLPAVLNSGQCFTVDERRDGKEMIEGGREGGRSLL